MKKMYLLVITTIVFTIGINAQVINFSNTSFKNYLVNIEYDDWRAKNLNGNWTRVDLNDNGEIEVSEAENISYLRLEYNSLTDVNEISNFINLNTLIIDHTQTTQFSTANLGNLIKLEVSFSPLSEIDLSGSVLLEDLILYQTEFSSLEVADLPNLSNLNLAANNLTELNISNCNELDSLTISENNLPSLDLSSLSSLKKLYARENLLEQLDVSNLTNLTHLYLGANNLSQLDLSNLVNLTDVSLYENDIATLDVSNQSNLRTLVVNNNNLTQLDTSNLIYLEELLCFNNAITDLDISGCTSLKSLDCSDNNISTLDASNFNSLEALSCNFNNLTSLNVNNCINLSILDCDDNLITELELQNLQALSKIYCSGNNLNQLDVSNLSNLTVLICSYNELDNLNISGCSSLWRLWADYNQLSNISFEGVNNLHDLYVSNNNLASLDLSNLANLTDLKISHNGMNFLNVSGTQINNPYLSGFLLYQNNIGNNFIQICCNPEAYLYFFIWVSQDFQGAIVNVGENCEPVYQSYVIEKFDSDNDGCEETDVNLSNFVVNVSSANNTLDFIINDSNIPGIYSFEENAIVTPVINNNYFTITPEFFEVDYSQSTYDTISFCIAPIGNFNDLEMNLIPYGNAIPGFDANYKLIFTNKGTTTLSGNISLTFEDDYMNFISSTPNAGTQSVNSISWNYSDLAPFESREIVFSMQLNTPTDSSFPLNSGDILSFQALANPIETDETPIDNVATLQQEVVNSFDPNDKILLEGDGILPEMVGEYVTYRIRFENTGTAGAINVVVEDNIDPAKFDISTLEVVDASHNVRAVINGNLVKFQFYNILLPFDDENNDGYVVFKIKTLESLQLNDTFSNQASIFFDYNAPIITNEYVTTITENLGVEDIDNDASNFTISPNPAKDYFKIYSDEEIQKVELFDANGRLLSTYIGLSPQYNIENMAAGFYLLKIYGNGKVVNEKLIVK